jgi:alpha-beta hydrolase superfamily lysophospholipase
METATAFEPTDLVTTTGAHLAVRFLPASSPARGVVQINHGLAEHARRYRRFAEALSKRGYHVYAHDHRCRSSSSATRSARWWR